jgi:S1-C subfamily serine protease
MFISYRNSAAAAAGLRPDDLVVTIDSQVASSCRQAAHVIERSEHDATIHLAVLRGEQFLEVTLKAKPMEPSAKEKPAGETPAKEN